MNDVLYNFGESFQFYATPNKSQIYTCYKEVDGVCRVTPVGYNLDGMYTYCYVVELVEKRIQEGRWIVIPSQPEEILTCEKSTWQLIQDALTDSNGRISVEVFKGAYNINHSSLTECFENVEEEDLGRLLDALVVLDCYC